MQKHLSIIATLLLALLLSGCGDSDTVRVHGMKGVKFVSLDSKTLCFNLTLDAENTKCGTVKLKDVNFTAWLGERELGTIKTTEKIKLKGRRRSDCVVPVQLELNTLADALKLTNLNERLLSQIKVEGSMRGSHMLVSKKIHVDKQPLLDLIKSAKITAPKSK